MHSRSACGLAVLLAVLAWGLACPVEAGPAGGASPLFRVILTDGTALVSFGEFTRVGDRVVFSMPLGSLSGDRLQLVNLPAALVDWEATKKYAEATRYAQYVATRAEADFAVLTGQVAEALNEIGLAKDPARRLQIAEQARRTLAGWPAEHFGYRSGDVREMDSLLEGTISQLRAAAGVQRFDFSLVAAVEPPAMALLPDPTPAQAIDQTLLAARWSDVPAERMALLRSVIGVIDENRARLPKAWARRTRAAAKSRLDVELAVERRYEQLSRSAMQKAAEAAAGADVRGVERVISDVHARDRRIGEQRKDSVAGLIAALQDRLDSAQRLRLMRDQWSKRADAFHAYRSAVAGPIGRIARLRPRLEDVKALAGPDVNDLPDLVQRFERAYRQIALVRPPDELASAHATLLSAVELGQQALRARERATSTGDLSAAWDASSAAAGSIMLLAQARQQIDATSRPPELR